nr:hypothetical protein [uncultured bacterium]
MIMNIGIRLHDTMPGTLEERLVYARAQGFSCVHLAMSKVMEGFRMDDAPALLTPVLADRVRKALDENGIECAVLGCYLKLATKDPEELAHTREIYRAHLRFARLIGARAVGTETPPSDSLGWNADDVRSGDALSLFTECLRPLALCAEEEGTLLAVEPVCDHIVSTPERMMRVLNDIGSGHLRVILDAVNLIASADVGRAQEVVDTAVGLLGDSTEILHMKDFVPAPGQRRPAASACGTGRMRYDSLLALAARRGIPMTLENTTPQNAEQTRLYLERLASAL